MPGESTENGGEDLAMDMAAGTLSPEIDAEHLQVLAARLEAERGFDLLGFKPRLLRRRLISRLRLRDCPNLETYLRLLEADPEEEANLLRTLTIHVSGFFRNVETFDYLRERVFPGLIRRKRVSGEGLSLLSAGCAEGEEPYSLALMLGRHFGRELAGMSRRIIGIDVDEGVVARARLGVYEQDRIADLPGPYRRLFHRRGELWELDEGIRREVEFEVQDLKRGIPHRNLDLVLCRNVLIYFKRESQKRILAGLSEALAPGGLLVLGKTESLLREMRSGFRVLDLSEHVYCKAGEEPCGWR